MTDGPKLILPSPYKLVELDEIDSTNAEALRRAEAGEPDSTIVWAKRQTAGHGRRGREWASPEGNLYFSILLRPPYPVQSVMQLGFVMANAIADALAVILPRGAFVHTKWPNDVLVEGRKVAGVLIETTGDLSLVGIGLNLVSAPLDTATCVARYVESGDRDEWAQEIVRELIILSEAACDLEAYRAACLTLGQRVRLEGVGADASVEGVASDVDGYGRLVVMTTAGERIVSSGECLHLRAADPSS
ncbi:biotin--[acetyl-CoA-carboxylase] ligase [Candidatus Bipolaricaulota bacterium]|nr:biotin--[acetyl-CoA-carboxylase] ligase [Candidatus Bipolaricaulota bacterium]